MRTVIEGDYDYLYSKVRELFTEYLDVTEESDSGRVFHPIAISCCRAMKLEPLGKLITELRGAVHLSNP